jgi:hypothetical protein
MEDDREVGLKMQEKIAVVECVKSGPRCSSTEVRRSLLDASPDKQINQARVRCGHVMKHDCVTLVSVILKANFADLSIGLCRKDLLQRGGGVADQHW